MSEYDQFIPPEQKEYPVSSNPEWLAGIFEVGGAMYFELRNNKYKGKVYPNAYPFIKLGDNDLVRMQRFQELVGGKLNPTKTTSYQWYSIGQHAVWLAQTMEGYAPARQETIVAFNLWQECETAEDRIAVASIASITPTSEVTVKDYSSLVRNPNFLAGVIDARGSLYMNEAFNSVQSGSSRDYGWNFPRLHINTTNKALLEALHQVYGGSDVETAVAKGVKRNINGKETVINNDSLRWNTGHETFLQLRQIVANSIQLRTEILEV